MPQTPEPPSPQPNKQTVDYVDKAVNALKAELQTRFETRFDAMDKATMIVHEDLVRVPTLLDRAILNLRELLEEKITGVTALTNEKFLASEEAVKITFTTSEKAIGKSEVSTAESIRQLQTLLQAKYDALDKRVGDVTGRLDRGEGSLKGSADKMAIMMAVGGMLITGIIAVVAVATLLLKIGH